MVEKQFGYGGQAGPAAGAQQYGAITFMVGQMLNRLNTCTLVRVVAVTNDGGLSPVGFVDVQPLVNQLDGNGNATPHGVLHQLPYFRLQGGSDAVILDPKIGDIGMAAFSSRDISAVKSRKVQSNPGSWRSHDMADGIYFGGMLNGTPAQYVQFQPGGISIVSPTKVTVRAPDVTVEATSVTVDCSTSTVTASASAAVTAPNVELGASGQELRRLITSQFQELFNSHTHHENGAGSETNAPTQEMTSDHMTITVRGG
ncbi:Gp138 family membrane-puncturing spike protein [Bordetella genomosp. 1]|uniref:Gp138 family membrane-puncturing spike protein n=1 Tax=Bordetella genomosp. 1 TaxID=1395607 RepID=UPI0015C606BF|nr:Gp138 family membrane-puncturing spike protein [Bordetella genomosp. 1]